MPVWFRKNNGIWNNSASADPATGAGGFSLANVAGKTLYPSVQGTGDSSQLCNFGTSAFAFAVPSGFAGCPHSGGGFTSLDPAKKFGSAVLSAGNLQMNTPTTPGMAQTLDGYTSGKLYFEVKLLGVDVFSSEMGGGVGRDYTGQSISFWFNHGQFSALDPNGGALAISGGFNTYVVNLEGFNTTLASSVFSFLTNDVICIAFQPELVPGTATADMADFWFGQTSGFVDLSLESNRRKFVDVTGCPLYLGVNGQLPFNSAPPMFLSATPASASAFATNNGLGGTFGISGGSLDLSSGSPCCSESVVPNFNVPLGADPQVRLSISDDGGRTWNLVTKDRSIGKIGKYLQRLRWLKMGQFRQRIIKLEITDPVKRAFVGFYADLKQGLE